MIIIVIIIIVSSSSSSVFHAYFSNIPYERRHLQMPLGII